MASWLFHLIGLFRRLWVKATLFSILGLIAAALALAVGPYVPQRLAEQFGGDVVDQLLQVLASSMLVIATFSLGTMVSGHTAAASSSTPRAAPILVGDTYAQNAISTFIGTFLFSIVAQIALDSKIYNQGGRAVLFAITLIILAIVIATLIKWIDELSRLGQVRETLRTIEVEIRQPLASRASEPYYRGRPYSEWPADGVDICATEVGYVQSIDFDAMGRCLPDDRWAFYLSTEPGTFVHRSRALGRLTGPVGEISANVIESIQCAFEIADSRTTLQDPRFGLIILSEAASRALSPGVNDPGTAIDAIVTAMRSIDYWHQHHPVEPPKCEREWLYAKPMTIEQLIEAAYWPIARYGAGQVEVMIRLLKALEAVASLSESYRPAVKALCTELLARVDHEMGFGPDRDAVYRSMRSLDLEVQP